jgi:hypothetical protein
MPANFPIFEKPIALIDLDDTLSKFDGWKGWFHIGEPRPWAREFVREFKRYDWITVLWTSRADTGLLVKWLEENKFCDDEVGTGMAGRGNLTIDYINTHPWGHDFGMNPSKPSADLIIDNIAWPFCGQPVDLAKVMADLKLSGYIDWKNNRKNYVPHDNSHITSFAETGKHQQSLPGATLDPAGSGQT